MISTFQYDSAVMVNVPYIIDWNDRIFVAAEMQYDSYDKTFKAQECYVRLCCIMSEIVF